MIASKSWHDDVEQLRHLRIVTPWADDVASADALPEEQDARRLLHRFAIFAFSILLFVLTATSL